MKSQNRTTHIAANGSKWIRPESGMAIYLRDGLACVWCGYGVEDGERFQLDHLTPHSQGGSNDEANLSNLLRSLQLLAPGSRHRGFRRQCCRFSRD